MSQIAVWRGLDIGVIGFWHHGVLCPDGTVIHYKGANGDALFSKGSARIVRTSLRQFKGSSADVYDVTYAPEQLLPRAEAVRRAESQLGRREYDLFANNCESFARWCVTGVEESRQVKSHLMGVCGGLWGVVISAVNMSLGDCFSGRMVKRVC